MWVGASPAPTRRFRIATTTANADSGPATAHHHTCRKEDIPITHLADSGSGTPALAAIDWRVGMI